MRISGNILILKKAGSFLCLAYEREKFKSLGTEKWLKVKKLVSEVGEF